MVDPIGTVPALDLLTQEQLDQLFDTQNGYLSKVDETFNLLDAMDEAEAMNDKSNENETNKNNNNSKGNGNGNENKSEDNGSDNKNSKNDSKNNVRRLSRKHSRSASLLMDKKTLILDVDNTLIYVRHFMDEMRVSDQVKLGDKAARVTKLTYRLDLEFTEAGQMSVYDHIVTSPDEHIPARSDWFPDEVTKVALIHQADPTGCEIELMDEFDNDDTNNNSNNNDENNENDNKENENNSDSKTDNNSKRKRKTIEISFLKNSKELSQLEPMMNRPDYVEVDFMYGGYLVRIRPNLAKFLAHCSTMFDVILFTAADGSVYKGLLHQVHELLKQKLSEEKDDSNVPDPPKLWSNVFFRDDCDEKFDEHGLPYRHKNLSKLGRDLSQIVMVDDNPLSYRGYEPNSVRVAGFWGHTNPPDNELINTLLPTLITVSKHKDVRYHLSGLEAPSDNESDKGDKNENDDGGGGGGGDGSDNEIEHHRKHSRQKSSKFLDTLKKALDEDMDDENDNDDDDDDIDSLDNSSSGKDLKQAANEHAKDPNMNGLLPQPKQATRSKKQQQTNSNNNNNENENENKKSEEHKDKDDNENDNDNILSEEEMAKMSSYTRGHSDSVRIHNDKNEHESSMASTVVDNVIFYNMDDDLSSQAGKPLQISDGAKHKREDSDFLGQHILQASNENANILHFEPFIDTKSSNDDNNIDNNKNDNNNDEIDDGRRNSIDMANDDNNDDNDNDNVGTNRRESISHESVSQSISHSESKENDDNKNSNDNKNKKNNLSINNENENNNEQKSNHISTESAALNEKYGFVSVNDTMNNNDNNNNNENENENDNNDDEIDEIDRNAPAYISGASLHGANSTTNDNNIDNHYPLTDDEDINSGNKSSSCLCFGLFSKKKKTKSVKSSPMAHQELR